MKATYYWRLQSSKFRILQGFVFIVENTVLLSTTLHRLAALIAIRFVLLQCFHIYLMCSPCMTWLIPFSFIKIFIAPNFGKLGPSSTVWCSSGVEYHSSSINRFKSSTFWCWWGLARIRLFTSLQTYSMMFMSGEQLGQRRRLILLSSIHSWIILALCLGHYLVVKWRRPSHNDVSWLLRRALRKEPL